MTLLGLRVAEDAAFPVAEESPLGLDTAIHGLHVLEVIREWIGLYSQWSVDNSQETGGKCFIHLSQILIDG